MRSLEESVRRLDDLASKLNRATDKLNEQIEAIEQRLSETRIGLELWLKDDQIPADPLEDSNSRHFIVGWAKIGESWRLVCRKYDWDEVDREWCYLTPQPLTNAPRHVRMRAIPLVLTIVERLGNEAERWLEDVERALQGTPELEPPPDDEIPF